MALALKFYRLQAHSDLYSNCPPFRVFFYKS